MGEAFSLAAALHERDANHAYRLREIFLSKLKEIKNLRLNADLELTVPQILSIRFEEMLADALLTQLPQLAVSTSSACQGSSAEGSHVLRAMGHTQNQIKATIRISLGRFTNQIEVEEATDQIKALFNLS